MAHFQYAAACSKGDREGILAQNRPRGFVYEEEEEMPGQSVAMLM
jgi:hypothetical protein